MLSGRKVRGLLRGLRYISQIFENNEKEEEIQIGHPTDVKHVAHIGWDGPTVNSPSWMSGFKTFSPGFSSAPLNNLTGDVHGIEQDNNGVKWVSEDSNSSKRSSRRAQRKDLPELPKGSRRPSSGSSIDSPTSEKSRQSRRPLRPKDSSSDWPRKPSRLQMTDGFSTQEDEESPKRGPQEIPKKIRRKKSESSKLRSKAQSSDPNLESQSPTSVSNIKE